VNKTLSIALAALVCGGSFLYSQGELLALEQNSIPSSVAQGKAESSASVDVSPYGIVLSFEDLRESIEKYWAADDTYLRVGTNAPLGPQANILFLKTEGKRPETDSGTTLTVKTKDVSGRSKTYSFFVEFTSVKPKYAIVRISPDEKPISRIASRPVSPDPAKVSQIIPNDRKPAPIVSPPVTPGPSALSTAVVSSPASSIVQRSNPVPSAPSPALPSTLPGTSSPSGAGRSISEKPLPAPLPSLSSGPSLVNPVGGATLSATPPIQVAKPTASVSSAVVTVPRRSFRPRTSQPLAVTSQPRSAAKPASHSSLSSRPQAAAAPKPQNIVKPRSVITLRPKPAYSPVRTSVAVVPKNTVLPQTNSPKPPVRKDLTAILFSHTQANALVRGLAAAAKIGEVGSTSITANKVQNVVRRLRRGEDLMKAAQLESLPPRTIDRLLKLGKYQNSSL
jgi:hypothetical protein